MTQFTRQTVRERLEEAVDVLQRLRVPIGPNGYGSNWPAIVRSVWDGGALTPEGKHQDADLRPAPPMGSEIDRMDEALAWFNLVDEDGQKIVMARIKRVPWWKIQQRYGKSERYMREWFNQTLDAIAFQLNNGVNQNSLADNADFRL